MALPKSYSTSEQRERHNAKCREYYRNNKARMNAQSKAYALANKDKFKVYTKRYRNKRLANDPGYAEVLRQRLRDRRNKDRDAYRAKERAYIKRRKETDLNFLIKNRLRTRLSCKLKACKTKKRVSTMALTGCTAEFLIGYLEARFLPGMTWKNVNIDHYIPCAEFDLTNVDQQRQCFHYSNLRPMFAWDNKSKGAKRPPTHQAELI